MASINKVMLLGRLGKDPELRFTQSQTAVCTLSLATTEFRSNATGERQEFTEWHRVVVWGRQAENASKYLKKGRGVFVEGKIQTKTWDDAQGQRRYSTEIIAHNIQFLPQSQPSQYQMGATQYSQNNYSSGFTGEANTTNKPMADNGAGFPFASPLQPTQTNNHSQEGDTSSYVGANASPSTRTDQVKQDTAALPVINDDEDTTEVNPSSANASKDSNLESIPF